MSFIEVRQISKTFKLAKKKSGLLASFKSFFKREYTTIQAVDHVSFEIDEGEIVIQENAEKLRKQEKASIDEIFRRKFYVK